ncbi:mono and diacylglycerol lipase precursor [Penicillium capsulatum]|nr:mono and diacylglycerol lipase precursor [Penicillium capsulatum]
MADAICVDRMLNGKSSDSPRLTLREHPSAQSRNFELEIDMRLSIFTALSAASALGHALPNNLQSRDISPDDLSQFKFWAQYAAASYCYDSYTAEAGHKLSCSAGNCLDVEKAGASIAYTFSNTTATDTAGYVAVDDTNKAVVLAIRGSYSVRNWIADVEFPYTNPHLCDGCQAELGFWDSWTNVRDPVSKVINETLDSHSGYDLVVVGHSLGAGVATLAAADLRTKGHPEAKLYAYASPRVANSALAKFITAQKNNHRFTHTDDPVPKLPLLAMGYVHVSPEYYITSPNNATVSAKDVNVLEGEVNWKGNTGTGVPSLTAFSAHHWYFEKADGCKGPGLPWKV